MIVTPDVFCCRESYHRHAAKKLAHAHPHERGHHLPPKLRDFVSRREERAALKACAKCSHGPASHEMLEGYCYACQCPSYEKKEDAQ